MLEGEPMVSEAVRPEMVETILTPKNFHRKYLTNTATLSCGCY